MNDYNRTVTGAEKFVSGIIILGMIFGVSSCIVSGGPDEDNVSSSYSSSSSKPDAVDAAYSLCAMMDNTRLVSECEIKGWGSTVDVTIDTVGSEAVQMCSDTTSLIAGKTTLFSGKGWKLRIFSPYSGDRPLATCTLR